MSEAKFILLSTLFTGSADNMLKGLGYTVTYYGYIS